MLSSVGEKVFSAPLENVLSRRHCLFKQKLRNGTGIFLERRTQILLCLEWILDCTPSLNAMIQAFWIRNSFN